MKMLPNEVPLTKKPLRCMPPALSSLSSVGTMTCAGKQAPAPSSRFKSPAMTGAMREAGSKLYEMLGMTELMRVAYEKGEIASVQDRLSIIMSEAAALSSTLSTILEFMKIESEPVETASRSFDIVALLHEISGAARSMAGNKPVTVMDASAASPLVIVSDPSKVRQIMTGLMSNAIKFTDRGRIAVILNKDDDRIRLTVTDTGRGMSLEQIDAVFTSSDHGYDDEVNGTATSGLGLRIVKNLVKQLNGSISVASKTGEGTIVEVALPLEPPGKPVCSHRWMEQQLPAISGGSLQP
jgi:signal transduction histidine kinase